MSLADGINELLEPQLTTLPPGHESSADEFPSPALDLRANDPAQVAPTTTTTTTEPELATTSTTTRTRTRTRTTIRSDSDANDDADDTETDNRQTNNVDSEVTTKTQYKYTTTRRRLNTNTNTNVNVNKQDADASADAAVNDASRNAGNPKGLSSVSPSVNSIRNTYSYAGRRQPQRTASESTAPELTTTELPVSPTNSIISSPRPFGYPRRRPTRPTARPTSTTTTTNTASNSTTDNVNDNDNDNKQTQTDDIASKAKTRPSQVDRPKVSANHSQVVQLELEPSTSTQRTTTTTIAAAPSRSEVVDLNVAGNGDPNLRHDVVSNNPSLSINADDNQTQTKIKYTWRAARPTTHTATSGALNALDSSDKDSRKYAGKRLADIEDGDSVSYRSRHLNSAELQEEEAELTTIASTNARRGYQSINRSLSRTGDSKDASSITTEQKKETATEEEEKETVSSLSGKRNYQSISRSTSGSTNADEQIHYTALTRDSSGSAHLSEGRSSSFTRNLGVTKAPLITVPISRGGHISTETVVEDENIAAEIIDDELPVVTRGRTIAPASKPSSEDSNTATEQESKETATDIPTVKEQDLETEEATTVPAIDVEASTLSTTEATTSTTEQVTTEGTLLLSSSSTIRPTTSSTSTTTTTEEPKTTTTLATTTATPEQVEETVVEQLAEVKPSVVPSTEQPQRQSLFRTKTPVPSAETEAPTTTTTSTTEPTTTTRRSLFRNRGTSTTSPSTTTPTTATTAKTEDKSTDEVVGTTPLPKRRVIVRGSYRPRKEGDLSSLLAVDANKRARYNHQPDPITPVEQSKSTQQVGGTLEAAEAEAIEKVEKEEKEEKSEENIKRVKVNSRAPIAAVRNRTSSQTEVLGNGITRTRTTYVRTIDEGKVVKRVHTKTIQEKPAEYEYVYDEASEPAVSTTPRAITRNRGSVRFQSNDLSSLLALDFASRAQRNKQTQSTVTKTRRRLLKKPKERLEHEEVEEFVYEAGNDVEDDEEEQAPAPTRPSTTAPIQRRTRPTRPSTTTSTTTPRSTTQRTTSTTTELPVEIEHEASTRRTGFVARRPTARPTTTTKTTTEPSTTTAASVEATTRRVLTFKRPVTTTTTTTEKPEETSTEAQQTVARNFLKHLTANKTTTTTTTTETQPTTTTTASLEITDDLTELKRQFTSALDNLQSGSQTEVEATTPENDLKEASSGEKLSLPIYHRRNYYQYDKDSPITYIDKAPAPPDGGRPTVDIQKQIHDVFNVSDNGTPSNNLEDGEVDSAEADHRQAMEQAQEINSELSHFLLSTPGSV